MGDFHRTSEKHPHHILGMDDASRAIWAGGGFSEETTKRRSPLSTPPFDERLSGASAPS